MEGRQILDLPMEANDSGADSIRGYLKTMLRELWSEGECFSGNSGWDDDLCLALIVGGAVSGELDGDGRVEKVDAAAAYNAIEAAIDAL